MTTGIPEFSSVHGSQRLAGAVPHFSLTVALLSFCSSDLCRWPDLARGRAPLTDHIQGQWNGGKDTDQCQSHSRRFALVIV
jgi:hypothetical protein